MAKSKSTSSIQDRAREILRDPVQGFWAKWAIATAAGFVFLALIDGILLRLFSWPVDLLMAGTAAYLYLSHRADQPAAPKTRKVPAKKKPPASSKPKSKPKAATKAAAKQKAPVSRAKRKPSNTATPKVKPAPAEEPKRKAPVQRKKAVPKKKAARRAGHRPR